MLAQQDDSPQKSRGGRTRATRPIEESESYESRVGREDSVSSQGEGGVEAEEAETTGGGGGARARSRVPWHLLDELDAEKTKLRVSERRSVNRHDRVLIVKRQVTQCCEIRSGLVNRKMDRLTDVSEVSSGVSSLDGSRVRGCVRACVASVRADSEF